MDEPTLLQNSHCKLEDIEYINLQNLVLFVCLVFYSLPVWSVTGVFIHKANLSNCGVESKYFADRLFPNLLVVLVTLTKTLPSHTCLNIPLHLNTGTASSDFKLTRKKVENNARLSVGPLWYFQYWYLCELPYFSINYTYFHTAVHRFFITSLQATFYFLKTILWLKEEKKIYHLVSYFFVDRHTRSWPPTPLIIDTSLDQSYSQRQTPAGGLRSTTTGPTCPTPCPWGRLRGPRPLSSSPLSTQRRLRPVWATPLPWPCRPRNSTGCTLRYGFSRHHLSLI